MDAPKLPIALSLRNLTKRFEGVDILKGISLDVRRGEMVTLLGPSGCGKSTSLNCVAGIIAPDAGSVCIEGEDVTPWPIHKRDCGLVFQSFALFPHLTTFENVAFPLRVRKVAKEEIVRRVGEALELVGMSAHAHKVPGQLSGGQQQRVGLSRALVYRPKVLLFDEPLSNLDAKLRETMRFEIREIQRRFGITSIFVTHDQQEALAISDRIAVMDGGRIVQFDTPFEVYTKPSTEFVAGFIGLANMLHGKVEAVQEGRARVRVGGAECVAVTDKQVQAGDRVICSVRPTEVLLTPDSCRTGADGANYFRAKVVRKTFLGEVVDYRLDVQDIGPIRAVSDATLDAEPGDWVWVHLPADKVWLIEERKETVQ